MYDDYETTADLNEAIYYEKLDADREQYALEAEGREYAKERKEVDALNLAGDYAQAALRCSHGHLGKLDGSCSEDDPRYMEEGYRCYECGAVVTEMFGTVIHTR